MEAFKIIFGSAVGVILIFAARKIFLENEDDGSICIIIASVLVFFLGMSFLRAALMHLM